MPQSQHFLDPLLNEGLLVSKWFTVIEQRSDFSISWRIVLHVSSAGISEINVAFASPDPVT